MVPGASTVSLVSGRAPKASGLPLPEHWLRAGIRSHRRACLSPFPHLCSRRSWVLPSGKKRGREQPQDIAADQGSDWGAPTRPDALLRRSELGHRAPEALATGSPPPPTGVPLESSQQFPAIPPRLHLSVCPEENQARGQ